MKFRSSRLTAVLSATAITVLAASAQAATLTIFAPTPDQQVVPGEVVPFSVSAGSLLFPTSLVVNLPGDRIINQPLSSQSSFNINENWTISPFASPGPLTMSATISEQIGSPMTAFRTVQVVNPTPPANDNLASAINLPGDSGNRNASDTISFATAEASENNHDIYTADQSIWYTWTPSLPGTASINTGSSSFDTVLAVYTGNSFPLVGVESNDDVAPSVLTSSVSFEVVGGQEYKIAVDTANESSGTVVLNWNLTVLSAADSWNLYE